MMVVTHYTETEGGLWTAVSPPQEYASLADILKANPKWHSFKTRYGGRWDTINGWTAPDAGNVIAGHHSGVKHDKHKPSAALLPGKALLKVAEVLDFGAKKYAANNWRKGINFTRLLSAAERHLLALNDGEELDPETGLPHEAHAICELLFLLQLKLEHRTDLDDTFKPHRAEAAAFPVRGHTECRDRVLGSDWDSDTGVPSVRDNDTDL